MMLFTFPFEELPPLSAFPPYEPLYNYLVDNILLKKNKQTKTKTKTNQEEKSIILIFRMLIPERTEMTFYFVPILQLYSNFLAF